MTYDPIMKKAHRAKDALVAKYGHSITRLTKALQAAQKRSGAEYVSFPPRPVAPAGRRNSLAGSPAAITDAEQSKSKAPAKRARKKLSAV